MKCRSFANCFLVCATSLVVGDSQLLRAAAAQIPDDARSVSGSVKLVEFASGLRIDWERKRLELDCRVVLREGLLEFVVCSPQTKEHESILVTSVRPLHIYQAMGLIGLEPGSPPSYDAEKRVSIPAKGDGLSIQIKTANAPAVPMEEWLWEENGKRPLPAQRWVFAGSTQSEEGGFGADAEGTILAVVDMPTSLIALPEPHTEANDQLWLSARKEKIPPLGTECMLLIQSEASCVLKLELKDGKILFQGQAMTNDALREVIAKRRDQELLTRVDVVSAVPISTPDRESTLKVMAALGIAPEQTTFLAPATTQP